MLKRPYVEARYSDQYDLSSDDLARLMNGARRLQSLVQASCERRLRRLQASAEASR